MRLVVMKFGGTSVSTQEARRQAMGHVRRELEQGNQPVVVISAMGRKGAPYATDTLLGLIGRDADLACRDLLISCGETISACVFADELTHAGIPARPFTGESAGIRTTGDYSRADILSMDDRNVREAIREGVVPVITGFQGRTAEGMTTTIGRGGSDTSAVVIGGFLKADAVDIYTDVPGIAKADPRVVPQAPFMEEVSSEDMLFLANWGASVIHPKAVAAGIRFQVPLLRVRSTFEEGCGTRIVPSCRSQGLVGLAAVKNLAPAEGGDYTLGGRSYAPAAEGPLAILTALCHEISPEQLQALRSLLPELSRSGDAVQAAVPMEKLGEMIQQVYGILSR